MAEQTGVPEAEVVEKTEKPTAKKPKGSKKEDLASQVTQAQAVAAAAEQQLGETEDKLAEMENRLLRTAAEYDNHRKRSQKEVETAFNNGVAHAAKELLVILDTLETAANCNTCDEEYKKGVLLTLTKSEEVFKKLGITPIEALGKPFDPELHNAVMQEAAEGAESGVITREILRGYSMGERVIRHSMVAVAP